MGSDKVNFSDASSIAQALKFQIRSGKAWDALTPAAKEALDQIATAIARIVSGDGAHWDAIIGFAQAAKPMEQHASHANQIIASQNIARQNIAPVITELERDIRRAAREIPQRNEDSA